MKPPIKSMQSPYGARTCGQGYNGRSKVDQENTHFRTFFRKKFLSTMFSGKFHVDPEILSPQVKRGQEVIWSENNPNHDNENEFREFPSFLNCENNIFAKYEGIEHVPTVILDMLFQNRIMKILILFNWLTLYLPFGFFHT